jgi:hypothetical protein
MLIGYAGNQLDYVGEIELFSVITTLDASPPRG